MEGIPSVSTSALTNEFCKCMAEGCGVCANCYARSLESLRKSMESHLIDNGEILSKSVLAGADIPMFNNQVVRFDSFGELINENHLINLVNICKANPYTTFALWTKRKDIVKAVMDKEGKPDNMILIYSSPMLNRAEELPPHFDKVFTVYESEYALANNTPINCGDKKCINCRKCYNVSDTTTHIHEMLKADMQKYKKNGGKVL